MSSYIVALFLGYDAGLMDAFLKGAGHGMHQF